MCGTNKYGFPIRHKTRNKFINGFTTGDICRVVSTKGKYKGVWTSRVVLRVGGYLETTRWVINYKCFTKLHMVDGYAYCN